jgi:hypothetical protein
VGVWPGSVAVLGAVLLLLLAIPEFGRTE